MGFIQFETAPFPWAERWRRRPESPGPRRNPGWRRKPAPPFSGQPMGQPRPSGASAPAAV